MSLICPLCGKNKSEEALFCEECSRKIKTDYEVIIPEKHSEKTTSPASTQNEEVVIPAELETENKTNSTKKTSKEKVVYEEIKPKKPKKRKRFIGWFFLICLLLVAAFLLYQQSIRKGNLERSGWETAVKENTVNSYLTYMAEFPNGKHYVEADSNLRTLKNTESSSWEKLRTSDNTAELRDFIRLHPTSNYNPLVKSRLDSLSWEAALRQNTADSYSEYMILSESGEFNGDYLAYAEERYNMLFQSYPINENELDTIKTTIGGFYTALSSLSYNGVSTFLAPTVNRFFNSGSAPRDKIVGELVVAGARSQNPTMKFEPVMEAVQYEKSHSSGFKVNVPLIKMYKNNEKQEQISGYIVHAELNSAYQIVSIYETKPYNDAP